LLIFYTWFIVKLYSSLIRFVLKGCVEEVWWRIVIRNVDEDLNK
jgi:hypothetical protein